MSGPLVDTAPCIVKSKDGTPIAYTKTGSGPALVLVDGALCYRAFGPSGPLAALLAPHFTVYVYDRRGRGESGDASSYAAEREIEDLDAVIAAAGGSAAVYGISSGAALVLDAAAHTLPYDFAVLGDTGSGRPLPASRWESIGVPVLAMDGGKSPTWMRNAMRSVAAIVPGARYLSLEGQTHMLKPEVVAPVLKEFFS